MPFLLNRAGTRIAAAFSDVLDDHGLTLPMWRVLAAIHQEGSLRSGQLATVTSLESWTISRLLGAMAKKGLVRRNHESEDARAVTVHLTEEGSALIQQIIPHALRYEKVMLNGFSNEEVALLRDMLLRLYDNTSLLEGNPSATAEEDLATS